jgi:hypothetical protein
VFWLDLNKSLHEYPPVVKNDAANWLIRFKENQIIKEGLGFYPGTLPLSMAEIKHFSDGPQTTSINLLTASLVFPILLSKQFFLYP